MQIPIREAIFLCIIYGIASADIEDNEPQKKKKVSVLLTEEEISPKPQRDMFSTLGISEEDIEQMNSEDGSPASPKLTAGDEWTPEKNSKRQNADVDAIYNNALRFLEGGKGHGDEGKKAAYRLLQQASDLGHNEARKLIGFAHMFGDKARWSLSEAKSIFTELADAGSPDAHLGLGFMYSTGVGVSNPNPAKALVHYTFSAYGGNPLGMMALGYRNHHGVGVPVNCDNALFFYEQVAELVTSKSPLSAGSWIAKMRLIETDEPGWSSSNHVLDQDILEYYRFLADKGDTAAQVGLGQMYLNGNRGVEQNFELAVKYFSAAAEVGHAGAYAYLGKMYLHGTAFTPQDNTTAFQFFMKSADKGHLSGQSGLGIMYLQGRGVKKDYSKAYRLFSMAAEQGGTEGQLYLGDMFFRGLHVDRDFKMALKYYQMASQAGHILAYYNLGVMHASGIGVPRSCETAVEFFKTVAEHGRWGERLFEAYFSYKSGRVDDAAIKYMFMAELGYEQAQSNIAYILDKGGARSLFAVQSPNEVLARALVMWQRSANQEHVMSRIKLGDYHYYGVGTEINYEAAAQHYKIASERHLSAQAMFNLGYMHEQGLGLKKDLHLAKRYYDMAAEHSSEALVPVSLALGKLYVLFLLEAVNSHPAVAVFEVMLGSHWDIIVMTLIAGIVIVIMVRSMLFTREEMEMFMDRE